MDGWEDGWMDGSMNPWMDGWIKRKEILVKEPGRSQKIWILVIMGPLASCTSNL